MSFYRRVIEFWRIREERIGKWRITGTGKTPGCKDRDIQVVSYLILMLYVTTTLCLGMREKP